MAKVFTHANGIVGWRKTAAEEAAAPLPADAANVVTFDEDTNAALVADLGLTTAPYSVAGGVLKKNGVAVSLTADGDRRSLVTAAAAAVSANQTYLGIASPSTAQVAAQVRALTQQSTQLIKRLLQLSQ